MVAEIRRYFRIWLRSITGAFSIVAASRIDFVTFVFGKLLRMAFFFVFVITLFNHTNSIAGYDEGEVLLFFALMNLIDILTQLIWFRGLTDLQRVIANGEFDLVLTKPVSPLFWSAFRIFDFFDLTTLPAAALFLWAAFAKLPPLEPANIALGCFLLVCGLILAFSINVFLAALNFWTTELENAWWMYREVVYVARFPPEVFPSLIRIVFTFVFPILVIITFPTKAFLGILPATMIAWALFVTAASVLLARWTWTQALKHYTSASA